MAEPESAAVGRAKRPSKTSSPAPSASTPPSLGQMADELTIALVHFVEPGKALTSFAMVSRGWWHAARELPEYSGGVPGLYPAVATDPWSVQHALWMARGYTCSTPH